MSDANEFVLVPKAALLWLNGEGPDHEGLHFGESADAEERPGRGRFWWRKRFRAMLEAAPKPIPADDREEVADFDQACDDFAHWLKFGVDWKNSYYGASYKTRLRHAIRDIRIACDQMEAAIAKDYPTPSEGGGK